MAKDKFKKFDFNINQEHVYNPTNPNIDSDFKLVLTLVWEILVYILLFIPRLFQILFMFVFGNPIGAKAKINFLLSVPFRLIQKLFVWIMQAKFTAYLMFSLIVLFIFQFIYITPNPDLSSKFMTHPNHFLEGNFYSVFTAIFLHADLIHLGMNLLALLIFGRIVEKQFGFKMVYVFLGGGIFANIVSNLIWHYLGDSFYSIGASGAIASLIMFAIMLDPLVFTTIFVIPVPVFIVGWFLIFLDLTGVSSPSRINHFAHLAGYLLLLVVFFFLNRNYQRRMMLGFVINVSFLVVAFLAIKIVGIELF